MRAVVCPRYGPPDVLHFAEVSKPVPRTGKVLIRVVTTTVTVADARVRAFRVPRAVWLPARLSLGLRRPRRPILGAEVAGVVEAVGDGVTAFQVGEAVLGCTLPRFGAYAEYVCLRADSILVHKPESLSFEDTAAIPVGARTALHFLRRVGVTAGDRVMVHGASGSVGTYAVQVAKVLGAEVTGVCSTRNVDLVRSLGADRVIDYTRGNVFADGTRYDVVLDCVGGVDFAEAARSLAGGGTYVSITDPLPTPRMLWARLTQGVRLRLGEDIDAGADDLAYLVRLAEQGRLRPVIDRVVPLAEVTEAHRYVDTGRKRGNVVVRVGAER
ncbi:MAG: NAD(P)-dependent alcohol dehydrogenase [Bacteroidota bacterium]